MVVRQPGCCENEHNCPSADLGEKIADMPCNPSLSGPGRLDYQGDRYPGGNGQNIDHVYLQIAYTEKAPVHSAKLKRIKTLIRTNETLEGEDITGVSHVEGSTNNKVKS